MATQDGIRIAREQRYRKCRCNYATAPREPWVNPLPGRREPVAAGGLRIRNSGQTRWFCLKRLSEDLSNSFLEFQTGYQSLSEVRIGIVFKAKDEYLRAFYFEDWGGRTMFTA
jgi:hypothetical protein